MVGIVSGNGADLFNSLLLGSGGGSCQIELEQTKETVYINNIMHEIFSNLIKFCSAFLFAFLCSLACDVNASPQRTIVLIEGTTVSGQDMFFRGGIDVNWSNANRGTACTGSVPAGGNQNIPCAMPITNLNLIHVNTTPWRIGDNYLDWGKLKPANDGLEPLQTGLSSKGELAVGTPAVWSTNDPAYTKKIYTVGNGYTPLNIYGAGYWMLDVEMECNSAVNGWFEFKTFISHPELPGSKFLTSWEKDLKQIDFKGFTPPPFGVTSKNHMARCGMINAFKRDDPLPLDIKSFPAGWPTAAYSTTAVGNSINFDASASTNVTQYRWDLNGDAVYDSDWSTSKTASFVYTQAGTYKVRLWARDEIGKDSFSLKDIKIVAVPNVIGQSQAAAQAGLTAAGFTVGNVTQQTSSTISVGNVISQSLNSGTLTLANTSVNLVISTGTGVVTPTTFHLRGTHNGWVEGDLFISVVGSSTQFEICRNFDTGDALGGPRFKVDPNGGWGSDAFPAGSTVASDEAAAGWTRIVIDSAQRKIITKTIQMQPNCPPPAKGFHFRGTANAWIEGDLLTPVSGSSTKFEICRNFIGGDAQGGPRFKIDQDGGWGADSFPPTDKSALGWTKITFDSTTKIVETSMQMAPNCPTPAKGFHLRGTHNQWLEGDLLTPVSGSSTKFEACRNFIGGDALGGPRFKIDQDGGWGADSFPPADKSASGWTKVIFDSSTKLIETTLQMAPNCPLPAAGFHLRGTHNQWLEGDLFTNVAGSLNDFEICRNFIGGDEVGGPRFKIDPNGGWGDAFPPNDMPAMGWTKITFNSLNRGAVNVTTSMSPNCLPPALGFHLRGTHNQWAEGDLFSPVPNSPTKLEICRNFTVGDAQGGPRFKVDPDGGWGGDSFPADDFLTNGWTKIVIDSSTRQIVSVDSLLPINCGVNPVNPVTSIPISAWIGRSDTQVTLPSSTIGQDFLRTTDRNCDFTNIFSCADGQATNLNGLMVTDTTVNLQRTGYYLLKDGSKQSSLTVSSSTEESKLLSRERSQIVSFKNKFWLIGGRSIGQFKNDIWSSKDAIHWTKEVPNASFPSRFSHHVVVFNNQLWLYGGANEFGLINDVWHSVDGITWKKESSVSLFTPRINGQLISFNNKLWMIGGYDGDLLKNDVWASDDGIVWSLKSAEAGFSPRQNHRVAVVNSSLIMVGGYTGSSPSNQVWQSLDGVTWTLNSVNTGFSRRQSHQLIVHGNTIVIIGGVGESSALNDIWSSPITTNNAFVWTKQLDALASSGRSSQQFVELNGQLLLLGGQDSEGNLKNDVLVSADALVWKVPTIESRITARSDNEVVEFNGKLWMIGGYSVEEGYKNDVWSSVDGLSWTQEIFQAAFPKRGFHSLVVFNNMLWLIGGSDGDSSAGKNDVWSSADGITWIQRNANAPFSARWGQQVVLNNNKLYLIGGFDSATGQYKNDVWVSPDGVTWIPQTTTPGFSAREGSQVVSFLGKLWLYGGYNPNEGYKNDIWSSSDGITWVKTPDDFVNRFTSRYAHQVIVHQNKLWLTGGSEFDLLKMDICWVSADGVNWSKVVNQSECPNRVFHRAISFSNRLLLMGGQANDGLFTNSIWSTVDGSTWRFGFRDNFNFSQ